VLRCKPYFVVELPDEPELPLELPEPMLPELELPELPDPMLPLLEPVLGEVGEVVELPEVPPLAAPDPDLLKCASHSERETCPSLLVSTAEKFGVELLAPALLLPDSPPLEPAAPELLPEAPDALDPPELLDGPEVLPDAPELPEAPDEPDVLLPEADGEDEDLSLLLDEELCPTATLDSANSAAAVAAVKTFILSMSKPFKDGEKGCASCDARHMPPSCHPA
jgi:hypothetical protein